MQALSVAGKDGRTRGLIKAAMGILTTLSADRDSPPGIAIGDTPRYANQFSASEINEERREKREESTHAARERSPTVSAAPMRILQRISCISSHGIPIGPTPSCKLHILLPMLRGGYLLP